MTPIPTRSSGWRPAPTTTSRSRFASRCCWRAYRAQLRQHEQSEDATFSVGPYTFKPSQKLLIDQKGGKVRLTEKEASIIKYLYRADQRVVTRDVLLEEVWGYNSGVTTHTLETHVYRLRQKIERDPSNAEILVTESGGYKLVP